MSKLSELSRREKVMLYALAILLIVVGGVFLLIKPAAARHSELRLEMDELQVQRDAVEAVLQSLPELQEEEEQLRQELTDLGYLLCPLMTNEDLDHLLTGLLLENQLTPAALTLSDVGYINIAPFDPTLLAATPEEAAETDEELSTLLANVCSFSASGARLHVLELLDAIDKCTYLLLNDCTIAQQEDGFYAISATLTVLFAEPNSIAGLGALNPPTLPPETAYDVDLDDLHELEIAPPQPELPVAPVTPQPGGETSQPSGGSSATTPPDNTTPVQEGNTTPVAGGDTGGTGDSTPVAPEPQGNTTPVAE